jgi:hypothetical protein
VLGSEQRAHDRIKTFLTSGLMSFDAQAFRVTLEEERLMGIADPGEFHKYLCGALLLRMQALQDVAFHR